MRARVRRGARERRRVVWRVWVWVWVTGGAGARVLGRGWVGMGGESGEGEGAVAVEAWRRARRQGRQIEDGDWDGGRGPKRMLALAVDGWRREVGVRDCEAIRLATL